KREADVRCNCGQRAERKELPAKQRGRGARQDGIVLLCCNAVIKLFPVPRPFRVPAAISKLSMKPHVARLIRQPRRRLARPLDHIQPKAVMEEVPAARAFLSEVVTELAAESSDDHRPRPVLYPLKVDHTPQTSNEAEEVGKFV